MARETRVGIFQYYGDAAVGKTSSTFVTRRQLPDV
jgi:hypothetical protein